MVLVKMLMEIDPLPMRGSLVMTMVMISPSRKEVSLADPLRWSPILVPPRFRLETAVLRPESFLLIFFRGKRLHIAKDGHERPARGPMRQGGAPTLMDGGWSPSGAFFAQYFLYILKLTSVEFQDFWSCAEWVSNICSFSSKEF